MPLPPGERAGAEELARVEPLGARRVGDGLAQRPARVGGGRLGDELAVDAHGAFERAPVRQHLVGGDDDARDGVGEVLGLLRAEAREHLGVLDVAGAEVVEDDEAADGGLRLLRRRVEEAVSEDAADLQLVIEGAGCRRGPAMAAPSVTKARWLPM